MEPHETIDFVNAALEQANLATYSEFTKATGILLAAVKQISELQVQQVRMPDAPGGRVGVVQFDELKAVLYKMNMDLMFFVGGYK